MALANVLIQLNQSPEFWQILIFLISSLRQKLSAAEGRVAALEQALARCDGAKNDAEAKLLAIHSHLRKQLGFDKAAVIRGRSRSPTRGQPGRAGRGLGFLLIN